MRELDILYFKKYAIDPDSELDETDMCIEACLSNQGNAGGEINTMNNFDWMDIE